MKPAQANITLVNRPIYTMEWESEDWGKFKAEYDVENDDLTVWWWDDQDWNPKRHRWSGMDSQMVYYGIHELAKMFLKRYGEEQTGVSA